TFTDDHAIEYAEAFVQALVEHRHAAHAAATAAHAASPCAGHGAIALTAAGATTSALVATRAGSPCTGHLAVTRAIGRAAAAFNARAILAAIVRAGDLAFAIAFAASAGLCSA